MSRGIGTRAKAALVFTAVAGVMAIGAVSAVTMLRAAKGHKSVVGTAEDADGAIGQTIPTSFGFVTVSHVEHLGGLSAKDLSNANHGVANLVESGKEQVQVSLEITSNLQKETSPYSPEQFQLLTTSDALAPVTTTIHPGRLQPFASVQGHFGFVIPADGTHLQLRFDDPGGSPITIDLDDATRSDAAPAHDDAASHDDDTSGNATPSDATTSDDDHGDTTTTSGSDQ